MSDEKMCTKCREFKSLELFAKNAKMKSGFDSWCKHCHRIASAKHAKENPEKIAAHRKSRSEEYKEYSRRYRAKNPERVREYARNYAAAHMDDIIAWHKERPEKVAEWSAKRRARRLSAGGNGITSKQFEGIKRDYADLCVYCGKKKKLTLDHIVPLSRGGAHDVSNAAPCCKSCNSEKNNTSLLMFMYRRVANV